jgi:hypothetical protein
VKNLSKTIPVVLAIGLLSCVLFSPQVRANTIQGNINFMGSAKFNTFSLEKATRVWNWGSSVLPRATGDFSGIAPFTPATMAPTWMFNPSLPTLGLWSVGGFTFDLLSATIVTQTKYFLNVEGTGIISGYGFDPTGGTWTFTAIGASGRPRVFFSFTANAAAVPDGGSVVGLLGIALVGIEVLRRKLRSA